MHTYNPYLDLTPVTVPAVTVGISRFGRDYFIGVGMNYASATGSEPTSEPASPLK